jgi:hypothetical protein
MHASDALQLVKRVCRCAAPLPPVSLLSTSARFAQRLLADVANRQLVLGIRCVASMLFPSAAFSKSKAWPCPAQIVCELCIHDDHLQIPCCAFNIWFVL